MNNFNLLFSTASTPVLRPIQHLYNEYGGVSPRGERPGREGDHWPPCRKVDLYFHSPVNLHSVGKLHIRACSLLCQKVAGVYSSYHCGVWSLKCRNQQMATYLKRSQWLVKISLRLTSLGLLDLDRECRLRVVAQNISRDLWDIKRDLIGRSL
jgi:hypothetical protein